MQYSRSLVASSARVHGPLMHGIILIALKTHAGVDADERIGV
jgi:hypothetical protein